ncbi:relaxase/mobilization nuclease domain-containing protein [Corynebacterium variabile]|uniref:relaxase/mobilization nuclease domain-containing protein n=1 Tax=Corynebacterium variabile TaxID=1727 RepID=UPI0028A24EC2|nr:relaxase/mobilization nuclease domain-containing protein [Corynebacterium variabile]
MSVTDTRACGSVRGWAEYVVHGNGRSDGDRVAAFSSDLGGVDESVEAVEALIAKTSRKNQGQKLIQSFTKEDLDPTNPDDVQRCNELGHELASRLAPDSPCIVVTHKDGTGGYLHNHVFVANHDYETGKSLRTGRMHFEVAKVNDELMKDHGLSIPEPAELALDTMRAKAQQRGEDVALTGRTVDDLTGGTWVAYCAAQVDEAMQHPDVTDIDSLIEVAAKRGVSIKMKHTAKDVKAGKPPSMTYALVDENGDVRKHKKSTFACGQKRLGQDFSYNGLQASIDVLTAYRQNTTTPDLETTDHVQRNEVGGGTPPEAAAVPDLSTALAGLADARRDADRHDVIDTSLLESAAEVRSSPGRAHRDAEADHGGAGHAEEPGRDGAAGRDAVEAGPDLAGLAEQLRQQREKRERDAKRSRRSHAAAGPGGDDGRGAVEGRAVDAGPRGAGREADREAEQVPEQGRHEGKRPLTELEKHERFLARFRQRERERKLAGPDFSL